MSKELTEKWKKSELEDGFYFIKLNNGKIVTSELETWYKEKDEPVGKEFSKLDNSEIEEVLAPCDYEEQQRLKEENKQMFDLLEMVARGITLYCDTEDVIRITSAVKKFCIAKRESEK